MKTRSALALAGFVIACVIIGLLVLGRRSYVSVPVALPPVVVHDKTALDLSTPQPVATAAVPKNSPKDLSGDAANSQYVSPSPGQLLARVNGRSITLKDLIPVGTAELSQENSMSVPMFEFLLQRAIDRELTFQVAQKNGTKLAADEVEQLKQLRAASTAPYDGYRVIQPAGVDPAKMEFDARDAEALMLQNNLMSKAGLASAYPDETQVQQYYANHTSDFGELPSAAEQRQAAWAKIDLQIREKLAAQAQDDHEQQRRQYLDKLRAEAGVEIARLEGVSGPTSASTKPPP